MVHTSYPQTHNTYHSHVYTVHPETIDFTQSTNMWFGLVYGV
jgi:hypothetical protein